MKITQLHIEGYRSLKNVTWTPGDINVVIGPNGSGKSNLINLLKLLSASASGKLDKFIQSDGGIQQILWDGQAKKINIAFKASVGEEEAAKEIFKHNFIVYAVNINKIGSFRFNIEPERLAVFNDDEAGNRIDKVIVFDTHDDSYLVDSGKDKGEVEVLLKNKKSETLLFQLSDIYRDIPAISTTKNLIENFWIYQTFDTSKNSSIRRPVITKYESVVDSDGQNLINALHTLYTEDRNFKENINLAMKSAFNDEFEELIFPPAADQMIQMRIRWKSLQREQSSANISDGTLRFLYLLTILANPNLPTLIAIDEPETGLHPTMFPIIADFAVAASKKSQIVFTTHSPQFLDAFHDEIPTTTVATMENGETKLHTLESEKLTYWLKEYTLGQLYQSGELEAME